MNHNSLQCQYNHRPAGDPAIVVGWDRHGQPIPSSESQLTHLPPVPKTQELFERYVVYIYYLYYIIYCICKKQTFGVRAFHFGHGSGTTP